MKFKSRPFDLNENELLTLENAIGRPLPNDYRAHLIKYNGGGLPPDELEYMVVADYPEQGYDEDYEEEDENNEYSGIHFSLIEDVLSKFSLEEDFAQPYFIVIGGFYGGRILMGRTTENFGQIFFNTPDKDPFKVAASFTDLINMIEIDED